MSNLDQMKAAVQRVANVYSRIANERLGCNLPIPAVVYFDIEKLSKANATSSGIAHRATPKIGINTTLMVENLDYALNTMIPHEIAHLVQFDRFDFRGYRTTAHGVEWRTAMEMFGKRSDKYTHNLDVTNAVKVYKEAAAQRRREAKKARSMTLLRSLS